MNIFFKLQLVFLIGFTCLPKASEGNPILVAELAKLVPMAIAGAVIGEEGDASAAREAKEAKVRDIEELILALAGNVTVDEANNVNIRGTPKEAYEAIAAIEVQLYGLIGKEPPTRPGPDGPLQNLIDIAQEVTSLAWSLYSSAVEEPLPGRGGFSGLLDTAETVIGEEVDETFAFVITSLVQPFASTLDFLLGPLLPHLGL